MVDKTNKQRMAQRVNISTISFCICCAGSTMDDMKIHNPENKNSSEFVYFVEQIRNERMCKPPAKLLKTIACPI